MASLVTSPSSSKGRAEILPERVLIHLHKARNLRVADVLGKSDPYVKVSVDGQFFFQSRCKRQTLFPIWEEACGIPPASKKVGFRKMLIEIYDYDVIDSQDPQTEDDFLGSAVITLEPRVLNNGPQWYKLKEDPTHGVAPVGVTGEVSISFRGNSLVTTEEVIEWMKTLDGIRPEDMDSYVAAFTEHEITGTTLDYLSRSGLELNKFGVKNLMHQATIAKEWRVRRREVEETLEEVLLAEEMQRTSLNHQESKDQEDIELEGEGLHIETSPTNHHDWLTHSLLRISDRNRSLKQHIADRISEQSGDSVGQEGVGKKGSEGDHGAGGGKGGDMGALETSSETNGKNPNSKSKKLLALQGTDTELSSELRHVARAEVVESEKKYVQNLQIIVDVFIDPVKTWAKMSAGQPDSITPEEINGIFGGLPALLEVNRTMLTALQDTYEQGLDLGPVFMSFASSLELYAEYVSNYEKQIALLESLDDRPRVISFLLACEMQKTCKGTPLRRFLSLPLLRIPQYKLLLREVLKYTHYEETAHPLLLQALERIDEVAHFVDDAVARASMHKRMLELQVEWHADILHTNRFLLKEGTLVKKLEHSTTHGGVTEEELRVILFNDCLIYGNDSNLIAMSSILHPNKISEPGQLYHLRRVLSLSGGEILTQGSEFHHVWNTNPGPTRESITAPNSESLSAEAPSRRSSLGFFRTSSTAAEVPAVTPRTAKKDKIDKKAAGLDDCSFMVVATEKTVEFHCADKFERDAWVTAIQAAITKLALTPGGSRISPAGGSGSAEVGSAKIKTRPSSIIRGGTLIPKAPAVSNLEFLSSLPKFISGAAEQSS